MGTPRLTLTDILLASLTRLHFELSVLRARQCVDLSQAHLRRSIGQGPYMDYASKVFIGKFFRFIELHTRVVWSKDGYASVCVRAHI